MTPEESREVGELTRSIDLGFAVKSFLQGELGKVLIQRAEERRAELTETLVQMPRHAVQAGEDIDVRARIFAIDVWQQELAGLINEGEVAQQRLIERDGEQPD